MFLDEVCLKKYNEVISFVETKKKSVINNRKPRKTIAMLYISNTDFSLIGKGTNGKVYKYKRPLLQSGLNAVVKVSNRLLP